MKFRRFASLLGIVTIVNLPTAATLSFGADDDLPPPQTEFGEEVPTNEPAPQAPLPDVPMEGGEFSLPSVENDRLPEPSISTQEESNQYQVNRQQPNDEIFLPTPAVQDNINYAPLGSPVTSRTNYDDLDWRTGMENRPAFSLHLGGAMRNYATTAVPENIMGATVGGSWRALNIAQTVFLHLYGSFTFFKPGDVGPYSGLTDHTMHVGPVLELGIGRRISLFGSFLRRSNVVREGNHGSLLAKNPQFLDGIDEPTVYRFGVGAQYDFYVIPHGSLGARFHLEQDIATFSLTMALEPVPRKKFNLNFAD